MSFLALRHSVDSIISTAVGQSAEYESSVSSGSSPWNFCLSW